MQKSSRSISFETITHPVYRYRLTKSYLIGLHHFTAGDDGYRVVSLPGDWVQLDSYGVLYIQKGYAWDGATGPVVQTASFLRASLVHDSGYQLIAAGLLPQKPWNLHFDRELYRIAREDGMPWWRAQYAYAAVRLFGRARTPYRPEAA